VVPAAKVASMYEVTFVVAIWENVPVAPVARSILKPSTSVEASVQVKVNWAAGAVSGQIMTANSSKRIRTSP